jgi:hypothetical protein
MGACRRLRERAVVLAMVVIVFIVFAVSGLALYAMHGGKPVRLKLSASLLKLATFSVEVDSADDRQAVKASARSSRSRPSSPPVAPDH